MQAQATRQVNEQHQITLNQSQVAVKTLLSASFGCILFLRSLLPEDNFGQTYLVVGDNKDTTDPTMMPSSQSSNHETGGKPSRYKIMTVKRGFSQEGDGILDYLEKGAFHALERQYLKRMVFALYLDEEDRQNIVEAWNFDFTYQQIPGSTIKLPVLSMTDSLSQDYQSSHITSNTEVRPPTLGEVKTSIRNMVHKLIAITQTLEELPKKRYATFKLEYYPHTPDDYEPPLFVAGADDRRKMFFSTHDVNEAPLRVRIGKVDTGFNNVTLEVHSIAGALPSADTAYDKLHLIGTVPQAGAKESGGLHVTAEETLAEDALRRKVVWDADIHVGNQPTDQHGLLGQRMEDGAVKPVGKSITGKPERQIEHVDQMDFSHSSDMDETQPDDGDLPVPGGIIARSSSATEVPPTISSTSLNTHSNNQEQDVADTMGKLTIAQESQSQDEVMNVETQQVQASWMTPQSEMEHPSIPYGKPAVITQSEEDDKLDESIDIEVHCDCAVQEEAEDYDVCQCEGPCGRWIHLWCHGYHGCTDPRLPESFKCFECRLRATQASLILAESSIKEYLVKYGELALFRRALKIIEVENPSNTTQFRKLVGCTAQVATQLWKRLEREEFIGPETIEEDGIGLFETRSLMHTRNGANKARVRKTAKTKYTKNPALVNMYTAYFDPSEEMERKHVGLGKNSRNNRSGQTKEASNAQEFRYPRTTVRSPLSFSNAQNQSAKTDHEDVEGLYQQQDSNSLTIQNLPGLRGKRKAADRDDEVSTPLRHSKRMKISVPRKDIDLEW